MTISLIFDIAIAAILLLCLIVGGVRGFISSLLSVAVFAAALLGSAILANSLADPVSDWLTPRVEQYVLDRLTNGHGDEAVSAAAASDNEALAGLVDFDAITGIAKKAMDSAVEAGKNMLEGAVTGMIRSLAYGLLFLVSFLVLTLLQRTGEQLAARAPVLGAVNRLAGAALGLCLGVLAMFAAASVLQWTGLVDAATLRDILLNLNSERRIHSVWK